MWVHVAENRFPLGALQLSVGCPLGAPGPTVKPEGASRNLRLEIISMSKRIFKRFERRSHCAFLPYFSYFSPFLFFSCRFSPDPSSKARGADNARGGGGGREANWVGKTNEERKNAKNQYIEGGLETQQRSQDIEDKLG